MVPFYDAAKLFGKRFLFFQIDHPADHDALGLGRSGAVHGFRQIAHCCSAQAEVFDQTEDSHPMLSGHTLLCFLATFQYEKCN